MALYFGRHPSEIGRIVSDIHEELKREDVDVLVIDICDDITPAYEAIQGQPIMGKEAGVLELRTKIASQCIDYEEKTSQMKASFRNPTPKHDGSTTILDQRDYTLHHYG